ncbi:MAG TPA: AGE family epimerase/isomerase, partial [Jatrophihabitans sp.]|nr:AGE family epimerase/isomerase [Jatrophihabitans sp.]
MDRSAWRAQQQRALLRFGAGSARDRGFGWLDDRGMVRPDQPAQLWINARMTYVFALATVHQLDVDADRSAAELAAHGVAALTGLLRDPAHDGWFDALDDAGRSVKTSYGHAFVLLAAATATAAGTPGAADLFADAQRIVTDRFWDPAAGRCVEQYRADWSGLDSYRGANSNMHQCEAFLAAGTVCGDPVWHARAESIARAVI